MLTVFTPTYNRAYTLPKLYKSLLAQSNKDFVWLLIDDGSTDTTKELVASWQKQNKIDIQYVFQKNQGMHGAHNTAYENIHTELNVCIDSDDYMPDDAVALILEKWTKVVNRSNIAGIVGLDIDRKGNTIGSKMPENIEYSTLYDIYNIHKSSGDKKLVLRTEVVNRYPKYPLFEGERFVPLGILYLMIDQDYTLATLNKPLCVVEYMVDGSSLNIFKQYKRHPKGFRYSRYIELKYKTDFKTKLRKILHVISSTLFIGDLKFFNDNPEKILTLLLLPFGVVFHLYVIYKIKLTN